VMRQCDWTWEARSGRSGWTAFWEAGEKLAQCHLSVVLPPSASDRPPTSALLPLFMFFLFFLLLLLLHHLFFLSWFSVSSPFSQSLFTRTAVTSTSQHFLCVFSCPCRAVKSHKCVTERLHMDICYRITEVEWGYLR